MPDYGEKIYYLIWKDNGEIDVALFSTKEAMEETRDRFKLGDLEIIKFGYEYLNADAL